MDADPTVSTRSSVGPPGSDTTPFVFGSTVGRFLIRERLGTGGMGEVYRAEDTQLKRTVAIKRLLQAAPDQSPATRLLKEAQRASALNHPRIASVYDVFTLGDELLLVMEFVDGLTLRERMKREVSIADFCTIAVQCTEALAAAHGSGILHGDLKPANIMLTRDGQVKVCDFGLARRLATSARAAETTTTTQAGVAGTPAYLAPEAILERPVDERADLFSLGVVFYQMLARRNPFAAESLMGTLDRILHASPEPLDRVNAHVPGRLARTIHRMIEKAPGDRPASAAEVGRAIASIGTRWAQVESRRRLVRRMQTRAAIAAVALLAVVASPRVTNPPGAAGAASAAAIPQPIHLVVLPFSAGGARDREPFIEGLTDSLNGQLSKLTTGRPFQVVTEADRRRLAVATPSDARAQLGANVALQGSLHYAGRDVDVAATLVDTRSGQPLRSERFTVSHADPLAVETRILEAATRMMHIELTDQERAQLSGRLVRPGARELYLRGRGYFLDNYDRIERVEVAIELFRKALDSDPKYALAYSGLGQAYWRKYELTRSAELVVPARGSCEAALGNDDSLAEAHICLATVLNGTGEYERAGDAYLRALDRDPTNDVAYVGLATAYQKLGRHADAERTYLRAIEQRPHYWGGYNNLGIYYYGQSRFEDALEMFEQVTILAAESFRGWNSVGGALFGLGRNDEAIKAFETSMAIRPNHNAASNLGTVYYFRGQYGLAVRYYREALTIGRGGWEIWGNLAHALEHLGEANDALTARQQARQLVLESLEVNPRNAALYVELADHHAALNETGKAKQALAAALDAAPDDPRTLFRLAVLYEARFGARAEALAWLTKAVALGQPWGEIEAVLELQELRKDPRFIQLRTSR